MQDIVKQLNSKNMEILKLTKGEEITVEDERKGLYEDRDRLYEDIKELKLKMISLMKELGSLKEEAAEEARAREAGRGGGKRKSKGNSKKVAKKPVVSQKKQSECKEILGKKMKIYKMPDSRKEYVKYKGELLHIADYKNLMKQKAIAKTKTNPR